MTSDTRWLTEQEQRAWRGYLHMTARLNARLQRDLQVDSNLSLADFSVLVQLSENPEQRMRVLELARALRWEKSRLSHQLARMERRGLVERANCDDDKRGSFAVLTAEGRRTIVAAAPGHVESVRTLMFDTLTPDQVDSLADISAAVIERIGREEPADCR
jgi:DNA-binding MarR family transcriptional regulator